MTAEEEVELSKRIQEGDLNARNTLVNSNLRLVVSIAKQFKNTGMSFMDMVEEGNLGLMKAAVKYNGEMGFRFSTYATYIIRQAITRGLQEKSRTVRVPSHIHESIMKQCHAIEDLTKELGRTPTTSEIAEETGLSEDKVRKITKCVVGCVSLDQPINDEDDRTVGENIEDMESPTLDEIVSSHELRAKLLKIIDTLPDDEAELIKVRYGFTDGDYKTLDEARRYLGYTKAEAHLLESKALYKLKNRVMRSNIAA